MTVVFQPSRPKGELTVPPSKSIAHRYLIGCALAQGKSHLQPIEPGEDILATIECLQAMGAEIDYDYPSRSVTVTGFSPRCRREAHLRCNASGSTLRFLIPVGAISDNPIAYTGQPRLLQRPLKPYLDWGLITSKDGQLFGNGVLTPADYVIDSSVSSQFCTGLLLALPLLEKPSTLTLISPVQSRPYIDITLSVLRRMNINVTQDGENRFFIPGEQSYSSGNYTIEGDCSNAAFFEGMNRLGGEIVLRGVPINTAQGDRIFPSYFDMLERDTARLSLRECPDLFPVLAAVAAAKHGAIFTDTECLRHKESDRGNAMAEEITKFGGRIIVQENEITVLPGPLHYPTRPIDAHNDHRIAMAMSLLLMRYGGELKGSECVKKSMPDFFEKTEALGAKITYHP